MSGRNRFPFTATQWQELEHQALIFKYVVSGIPIPPNLLLSIKRSCFDTRLFSRQPPPPHGGLNCFQVGLGRKVDPEPGRCRRTDGKKWRCSKEAYPDSKYCERHMHRGKNRSRKPLEVSTATSSTRTNPSLSVKDFNMDYRRNSYVYGVKEEVDEHTFFSGSSMDNSLQLTPLTMSSASSKQSEYSYLKLQSKKDGEQQKTVHRFFDEWPLKHRDSWLDLGDDKSPKGPSVSTTRLSISIPSTSNDFPIFNSRAHNDV
ncbi:12-oxophytodienoate reductase 3-like [Hibiscus syriacus]|uniref:Growth-regulating factor n=1 Tax=Hibiscus syriacus TaxID=106335 RepID=A0A6A2YTX2_HIBSY|nr:growth-regulating factor 5-like isoform X2 [Hibiscus syriacus]KAE8682918.1 12-oxophytodienoate reductase 3-like [Hibiscus syriacus]